MGVCSVWVESVYTFLVLNLDWFVYWVEGFVFMRLQNADYAIVL